jgi:putative ABC transport system permease protein
LGRSLGRRREIATLLALGAPRAHIIGQFIAESALLAVAAVLAGALAGRWIHALLVSALSIRRAPITLAMDLNPRILIFTAVMFGLTVLTCGVVPAAASVRSNIIDDLKTTHAAFARRSRGMFGTRLLVVLQLGLSITLLTAAGLLLHSLINLDSFNVGFDRTRVLGVSITDTAVKRPPGQAAETLNRIIDGVRILPGVQSASSTSITPISGSMIGINVVIDGEPAGASPHAFLTAVSPRYFTTMGIPLISGRDFLSEDDPALRSVVIINRTLARHYFGDESPLGKRLRFIEGNRPSMEIVGVAADAVYTDIREQTPDFLYLPRSRSAPLRAVLVVRTNSNQTRALIEPIRRLIQSLDSGLTVSSAKTLDEFAYESLHDDRVTAELSATFSVLAVVIAAIGLYGLLSVSVAQQTRNIGIRIALGADRPQIIRFVAEQGARLFVAGVVIGVGGAVLSTSMIERMLFGLDRSDPLTLVAVILTLCAAAALACYVPVRRALRVDPVVALRAE